MKWLIFMLAFSTIFFNLDLKAEPNNLEEQEILAKVLPSSCHFSGKFEQEKQVEGLPMLLNSYGDFFFSCGLGLIWNTSSPIQEVLFGSNSTYYKIDEQGNVEEIAGALRYAMSKIFLRLLKGDSEYFSQEFIIEQTSHNLIKLVPESEFLKKGINDIVLSKSESEDDAISITITIHDATGQTTKVLIKDIQQYDVENKKEAFERCEVFYPRPSNWCRMMRSPWRFEK